MARKEWNGKINKKKRKTKKKRVVRKKGLDNENQ